MSTKDCIAKKHAQELRGLLQGLMLDDELDDSEVQALSAWLEAHDGLCRTPPFAELHQKVDRILEDGKITEDERAELIGWSGLFLDSEPFAETTMSSMTRLQALLVGIAQDGKVTEDEVDALGEWMLDYEDHREHWPFKQTWELLDRICADGVISTDERAEVLLFCESFA